jgi:hypothetical protein
MDDHRDAQFTGPVTTHPAHVGTLVIDLVTRASTGDQQAWDALVERYAPLIWSQPLAAGRPAADRLAHR